MAAQLLEAARKLDEASLPPAVPELLSQAITDELSLDHVTSLATATQDGSDTTATLWAIYAALKSGKLGIQPDDDDKYRLVLEAVTLQIGQMMEPICSGAAFDEDSTDYALLSRNGLLGLHILSLTLTLTRRGGLVLPTRALLSVIAFTNGDDPWASSSCADLARSLLSDYFQSISLLSPMNPALSSHSRFMQNAGTGRNPSEKQSKSEQARFITEDVLTDFLRPMFAKSRPSVVTASGRPAAFPEQRSRYDQGEGFGDVGDDITVRKPWKYTRRYAVTVFEWTVKNADTELLQQHWPLYTPILLTLLDEPQPTSLKLRALSIFRVFWHLCPEDLFSRTGLAEVFEQAVFPTVLSLPSLTPEAESCTLLSAAYPALFDIAGLKNEDSVNIKDENEYVNRGNTDFLTASDKRGQNKGFSEAQRKLLDKVVREGVMVGYHHAKEHIQLVDLLCQTLCRLIDDMGILSVKYLKDIFPMISEILVDPFGTKYPPTLLSAMRLLQTVLQSCWPRIPHYCNEVIKIAMLCWLNLEDDDSFPTHQTKAELKEQLTKIVEMLSAIMAAAKINMSDRVCPLVAKDSRLHSLFANCEAK